MKSGIGISAVATYLPPRVSARSISRRCGVPLEYLKGKMGLKRKPVAGRHEHPSDLGLKAVRRLIARTGLDPNELGLIVYASSGLFDYQFWSPASALQKEIGANGAFCFELNNGCNAGNAALNIIDALMKANPHIDKALLVVSDTLSKFVDQENPDSFHLANFSDGAAAALIQRGPGLFEVLSSHFVTDSRFLNYYKVLPGGTRALGRRPARTSVVPAKSKPRAGESLGAAYGRHYRSVIETALERGGLSPRRIDYLFLNQGDRNLVRDIQDHFSVPDSRMHNTFADYGHIGGVDTFLALENLARGQRLSPGEHVVIGSSAIGFSWGATVLRCGKDERSLPS